VSNLLPDNNQINNIHRSVVQIVERGLPALCNFIQLQERKLTHEKIAILIAVHGRVLSILEPVRAPAGELVAILNSKQSILAALNHSAVRAYCGPFGVAGVRAHIETLLSRFARLSVESDSLAMDVREAQDAVDAGKKFCQFNFTFLTREFA